MGLGKQLSLRGHLTQDPLRDRLLLRPESLQAVWEGEVCAAEIVPHVQVYEKLWGEGAGADPAALVWPWICLTIPNKNCHFSVPS